MQAATIDTTWTAGPLGELAEVFGQEFDFWQLTDKSWQRKRTTDQQVDPPEAILDAALQGAGQVVVEPSQDHRSWVAAKINRGGQPVTVAGALIDLSNPAISGRLASRAAASVLTESTQHDMSMLVDGFSEKLADSFSELVFLRQLTKQIEYCEASRDLASVAGEVLPELAQHVSLESIALFEVEHLEETVKVGDLITSTGELPHNLGLWQSKLPELYKTGQRTVIKNYAGLDNQPSFSPCIRSIVVTPLTNKGTMFGLLVGINKQTSKDRCTLSNSLGDGEIGTMEATLLESAAGLLSTHASNVKLFQEKEELVINAIHTLVGVIEARDRYTCGHSHRVAMVSQKLAEEMGLSEKDCSDIYLSGLLHDIGKVGTPDDVLLKPGQLDDAEFETVKQHPRVGYRLLQRFAELDNILPGVLHHHEAFDGRGYPDSLQGEEIPLSARIMAVADGWDAMTSDRPYRKGMSQEKATSILKEGAGRQWDPQVIAKFLEVQQEVIQLTESWEDHLQEILEPTFGPQAIPPTSDDGPEQGALIVPLPVNESCSMA